MLSLRFFGFCRLKARSVLTRCPRNILVPRISMFCPPASHGCRVRSRPDVPANSPSLLLSSASCYTDGRNYLRGRFTRDLGMCFEGSSFPCSEDFPRYGFSSVESFPALLTEPARGKLLRVREKRLASCSRAKSEE